MFAISLLYCWMNSHAYYFHITKLNSFKNLNDYVLVRGWVLVVISVNGYCLKCILSFILYHNFGTSFLNMVLTELKYNLVAIKF